MKPPAPRQVGRRVWPGGSAASEPVGEAGDKGPGGGVLRFPHPGRGVAGGAPPGRENMVSVGRQGEQQPKHSRPQPAPAASTTACAAAKWPDATSGKNIFLAWHSMAGWPCRPGEAGAAERGPVAASHPTTGSTEFFETGQEQGQEGEEGCKQNIFAKNIRIQEIFFLFLSFFIFLHPLMLAGKPESY